MKQVHTTYTEPINKLTKVWNEGEASLDKLLDEKGDNEQLKEMMKKIFDDHR